jgi:hypothetical protein
VKRKLIFSIIGLLCLGFTACGGEAAPETYYPLDSETGYQPGGGMMPTFSPAEELETMAPSE